MERNELLMKLISDLIKNNFEDIERVEKKKEGIVKKSGIEDNTIINRKALSSSFMNLSFYGEENNKRKALYYYIKIKNGTYNENLNMYILGNIFLIVFKYGDVD